MEFVPLDVISLHWEKAGASEGITPPGYKTAQKGLLAA